MELLHILDIVVGFLWLPIFVNFFIAWTQRKNPISAAICLLVLFAIYSAVGPDFYHGDDEYGSMIRTAFDIAVCFNFYLAFLLSRKRFSERRKSDH